MRDPRKIVAAIEIASAMRGELADQFEKHKSTGWDDDVLMIELGRALGTVLRWQDARPSVVEHLVESVRAVYAGLKTTQTTAVDVAVRELCPKSTVEATNGDLPEASQPIH